MFETITVGDRSITRPLVDAARLLALAERIVEQNAKVLRANRELLALLNAPQVTPATETRTCVGFSGSFDTTKGQPALITAHFSDGTHELLELESLTMSTLMRLARQPQAMLEELRRGAAQLPTRQAARP